MLQLDHLRLSHEAVMFFVPAVFLSSQLKLLVDLSYSLNHLFSVLPFLSFQFSLVRWLAPLMVFLLLSILYRHL